MYWYKQSKAFLTQLDYNKFSYTILNVATSQFTEMMRKAGGDPLPTTEAIISNPQDYGVRIGFNEENTVELAELMAQNFGIQYSDGSIIISWNKLPQQNKQQARVRSGTLKKKYELLGVNK